MRSALRSLYFRAILDYPIVTLISLVVITIFFGVASQHFRMDASSDSLVLENDQALKLYRSIEARYGTDDFLVITYTPTEDLFSDKVKRDVRSLSDDLSEISRVESVTTYLDVPLIESPPVTLSDIQEKVLTLETPETNQELARKEMLNSPLYKNLLISADGKLTAIQVFFKRDDEYHRLLERRNQLREKTLTSKLDAAEEQELLVVSKSFDQHNAALQKQESQDIKQVRMIMDRYRDRADLFLGGIPMITSDSIDYIRHDIETFGIGVLIFLIVLLVIIFRQPRWIIIPMITCGVAGLIMTGFLGLVDWPVTVVSSNFISLMLIITLSLMVHLIVRYRELQADEDYDDQRSLIKQTITSKFQPSFFTSTTTIVAFASLIVSGIRPVIDFGWMMTIGISMSFMLAFTLFPTMLALLKPLRSIPDQDLTTQITGYFATLIQRFDNRVIIIFTLLAILSVIGLSKLSVENRFIDYYKEDTEIYQGMSLIDRKLGGTTPLDIILDAPDSFRSPIQTEDKAASTEADPFLDDFIIDEEEAGITSSYWFNSTTLPEVDAIHEYLDSLPETGKVLSVSTSLELLRKLDEDLVIDDFFLSILYKRLPSEIKQSLFTPYMSEDGNQIRFSIRVFESDPDLKREVLIEKIKSGLNEKFGLSDQQIQITGMMVLYNNLLQSLFRSQILTVGVVFFAILLMFYVSFRNAKMAGLAIIPNIFAASMVLGLMGWLSIPLDIMTITIAAICIGIGVDDTIHYVHRFMDEFKTDKDYWGAVKRSHHSIGKAMYYTTITITLGFSILVLSNFIPSIYFGLLTGFSMLVALIANLTLLPLLIVRFKPVS